MPPGTSYGSLIARTDTPLIPHVGDQMVSFTRCAEMAVHFASLARDNDNGLPTVFVLDRTSLRSRHRVEPYQDPLPDDYNRGKYEMEERVWDRDIPMVSRHLISVVFCLGTHIFTLSTKSEIKGLHPFGS